MDDPDSPTLRIAIVGPCSSGKTLLANSLKQAGYSVRQPAQEHSLVPDMWQKLSQPDILIYLDVDHENTRLRRPYHDGGPQRLTEQRKRLAHARQHCQFYIDTSGLPPNEVQETVLQFLKRK